MADIRSVRLLVIFAIASLLFFAASLHQRVITFDDAYFAEQGYWYNQAGYARSELFSGVLNWGERQYAYHKLHVWQIAAIEKFVGWSPYLFKAIPVVYLIIFTIAAYRYYLTSLSINEKNKFYIFLSLFFFNTYIIQYGFEARPDIMVMTSGFISYVLLRRGIIKNSLTTIIFGACFAGIAALFHLNGLIFIFAGVVLLLYKREYKFTFFYVFGALIVVAIYFVDIITNTTLYAGLFQLTHDPAVVNDKFNLTDRLLKFLQAPKRFVSHLYDASTTLLFAAVIYFNWQTIKSNEELKSLFVFFLASEISLAMIGPDNKSAYLVLHVPFLLTIISALLYDTVKKISRPEIIYFLLVFYVASQFGHSINIARQSNAEIIAVHHKIVQEYGIEKGDKIVAPAVFIFNEIGSATVKAAESFRILYADKLDRYTAENIFNDAKTESRKFLILRSDQLQRLELISLSVGSEYYGYTLVGKEADLYVFRKI